MKILLSGGASVHASRSLQTATTISARGDARPTKFILFFAAILFFTASTIAQTTNDLSDAEIQGRQLARQLLEQQPTGDFTNIGVLKIKDAKNKSWEIPIRFLVVIKTTNWFSIYEGIETNSFTEDKLQVVHQESLPNKYGIVHVCDPAITFPSLDNWMVQPLSEEDDILAPFCRSDFWAMDLGLEFFHWPEQKVLKKELRRSRECAVLESTNPKPPTNGYSRVDSWIDEETLGIVEAKAYDSRGKLLKEFFPKDFKKLDGQWQVGMMEMDNVQTGSRSRIEFDLKK